MRLKPGVFNNLHRNSMVRPRQKRLPQSRPGELFLKGPIPWSWVSRAARLPGRSLHVGLTIWHLAAMKRHRKIVLGAKRLRELGVNRHAAYRALGHLEAEGLVSVERHRGRQPVVEILDARDEEQRVGSRNGGRR